MPGERDPRAWRIDEDPFETRKRAGSHSTARDDGTRRQPKIHVMQVGRDGRVISSFFGEQGPYPCSTLVEVSALVFPELTVEIDAYARLGVDLRQAVRVTV